MPRIARITVPGHLHHVISRFVDRDWFFASDVERARYLSLLGRALARSDWRCLAYCLMSNHIHLAMLGGERDLESWAKRVNSPFARWLNAQRGRLGPVFADRPATYLVPPHREAEVIAYIHNNPVRAKVVASARDSSWSSHQSYLGLAKCPSWLDVAEGLRRTGCANDQAAFDGLVHGSADASLELPDLVRARAAVRRLGPYELGTPVLTEPFEFPVVRRRFVRPPPTAAALLVAVAAAVGLPASAMKRRQARGTVSMAKRVFIHAAVALGIAISQASATVNISRQRGARVAQAPLSAEEAALLKASVRKAGGQGCQS